VPAAIHASAKRSAPVAPQLGYPLFHLSTHFAYSAVAFLFFSAGVFISLATLIQMNDCCESEKLLGVPER